MNESVDRRRSRLLAVALALLVVVVVALVALDGRFGVNHRHSAIFHWHVRQWSLVRVDAQPERLGDVMVGLRVKAVLRLARDIPMDSAPTVAAANMPFGLMPRLRDMPPGTNLFSDLSAPSIRWNGQPLPTAGDRSWPLNAALKAGDYEVEQLFWLSGVAPVHGSVLVWASAANGIHPSSAYFRAHNATPYRDPTQLCRDRRHDDSLDKLSILPRRSLLVDARSWFFNGDRISAVTLDRVTDALDTGVNHDPGAWKRLVETLSLTPCEEVVRVMEIEMKRQRAELDAMAAEKARLTRMRSALSYSSIDKVPMATEGATVQRLRQQLGEPACSGAACPQQGPDCTPTLFDDMRFPPRAESQGTAYAVGPLKTAAPLVSDNREYHFLFRPTDADGPSPICLVMRSDTVLTDPQALVRSAPGHMRCTPRGCEATVERWARDDAWQANRERRRPELERALADVEATLQSARP